MDLKGARYSGKFSGETKTWSGWTPNSEGIGDPYLRFCIRAYNEDQNLASEFLYGELPSSEGIITRNENTGRSEAVVSRDPNSIYRRFVALPAAFTSIGSQFDNGFAERGRRKPSQTSIQGHLRQRIRRTTLSTRSYGLFTAGRRARPRAMSLGQHIPSKTGTDYGGEVRSLPTTNWQPTKSAPANVFWS